jgi:hypothetical protein
LVDEPTAFSTAFIAVEKAFDFLPILMVADMPSAQVLNRGFNLCWASSSSRLNWLAIDNMLSTVKEALLLPLRTFTALPLHSTNVAPLCFGRTTSRISKQSQVEEGILT